MCAPGRLICIKGTSLYSGTSLRGALFATKQSIHDYKLKQFNAMDGLLRRKKRSSQRRPTVQRRLTVTCISVMYKTIY